ncbi:MAG: substrate-binding domain-containing protein [Thermoanaerobaculia bacterium]
MNSRFLGASLAIATTTLLSFTVSAASLRVNGSTTVNPVAAEAAEILRAEKKMQIIVDTQGGSSGGISGIGDGSIELGMSSKPIASDDRAKYPNVNFVETKIGQDAVALVVAADVYNGGVKGLTKAQITDLYEGRITNWKQLGGPNEKVVFFNKEPGRGTWEVFAKWVYGDPKKAPEVSHPEVGGNEETRTKVISTRGSISQLSSSWAEGNPRIKALALKLDDGRVVAPVAANIASGAYPMSRPLFFISNGAPTGEARTLVDFVLSPRGQELVKKHGYLRLKDLEAPAKPAARPAAKRRK